MSHLVPHFMSRIPALSSSRRPIVQQRFRVFRCVDSLKALCILRFFKHIGWTVAVKNPADVGIVTHLTIFARGPYIYHKPFICCDGRFYDNPKKAFAVGQNDQRDFQTDHALDVVQEHISGLETVREVI